MKQEIIITFMQGLNTATMNLLVFLLFFKIYRPKYSRKFVYFVSYIVTTLLYITVNVIIAKMEIPLLNFVYTSVYINIFCLLMFECNLKKAVIINELFIMFGLIAEVLTTGFCAMICNESLETVLGSSQYVTICCLINTLLLIVVWRLFILLLFENKVFFPKKRQIFLFVAFSGFEAFTICSLAFMIRDRNDGIQLIIVLIGFVFLNAYIVYFIDVSTALYQKQSEYSLMLKQNKYS